MPRYAGVAPSPSSAPTATVDSSALFDELRSQAEAYFSAYQQMAARFEAAGAKALLATQPARSDSVLHVLQAQHRDELVKLQRRLRELGEENASLRSLRERDESALAPLMAHITSLEQRASAIAAANRELTAQVHGLMAAADTLRARADTADAALHHEQATHSSCAAELQHVTSTLSAERAAAASERAAAASEQRRADVNYGQLCDVRRLLNTAQAEEAASQVRSLKDVVVLAAEFEETERRLAALCGEQAAATTHAMHAADAAATVWRSEILCTTTARVPINFWLTSTSSAEPMSAPITHRLSLAPNSGGHSVNIMKL